jgi:hypothetical protein
MSALKKVEIKDGVIFADGIKIGTIEGRGEIWVHGVTGVEGERDAFVARFKHFKPKASAVKFIKYVFSRITMPEYLAMYATGKAPLNIAQELGMDVYA